jgi:basic membrane lipoprotein Med (substrate-binding protein (PBP1-ABC) superfamily)
MMKTMIKAATAAAAMLALAACGGNADDKAADNIQDMTENKAGVLEDMADNSATDQGEERLEDQAENVQELGEEKAEQADDNDDARVENEVANQLR